MRIIYLSCLVQTITATWCYIHNIIAIDIPYLQFLSILHKVLSLI